MPGRIGPYVIHAEIGRGGMGVVYSGSRDDGQLSQRAAVKLIKRGFDTEEVLKRFETERQVLSALNHPNIARVYEGGMTEDGRPYFAMEYIEGTSLVKYCDHNRLSTRERLELFRKVCDAVQYAHQNLIVHRDLKPSNIIVTEKGEPKLLDFGIVKLLNAPLFQAQAITGTGMRLMTPEYASPEQVRGDPVGTASDVYSLGVLLYELLTGRRPYSFASRVEQEIVRVVCEVAPERPSTVATHAATIASEDGGTVEIPAETLAKVREGEPSRLKRMLRGDIDLIVLKSLEKASKRRYQTAEQLSDDIVRYISGMPIEARPPSVAYKASKFVRRNRAGVITAALVFLSLTVGITATTSQWLRAETALDSVELERSRAEEAAAHARVSSELALNLAHDLVVQLPQKLNRLSGSLDARKDVAALAIEALEQLEELLDEAASEKHAFTMAGATQRLARIHDDVRNPSLGDTARAVELHLRAMAVFETLIDREPANIAAAVSLGTGSIYLGDLALRDGKIAEAEQHYTDAIEQLDPLASNPEIAARVALRQAGAREAIAKIAVARGEPERALEIRRENLAFRIRAWEAMPGSADASSRRTMQRNVSAGHIDVGDNLLKLGRYSEAEQTYADAIRIRKRLYEQSPDSGREPRDYAYALTYRARAMALDGRARDARGDASRAVGIMRDVFEADLKGDQPDQRNRRYLCEILCVASHVQRASGTPDPSLALEAEQLMEPIVARSPEDSQAVRYASSARLEQARVHIALGEWAEADAICTAVRARLRELADAVPDDRRVVVLQLEAAATQAMALGLAPDSQAHIHDRLASTVAEAHAIAARLRESGQIADSIQRQLDDLPIP